jgi:transcription termination factor Rho
VRNFSHHKPHPSHRPAHAPHAPRGPRPLHPRGPAHAAPQRQADDAERRFLGGTAVDPSPRIRLEDGSKEFTMRALDLLCPIGMGQRGLIVAPPGAGKTTFLKHICEAVAKGTPQIKLHLLLIDERPEEVTDFKKSVTADIRSSTLDQPYEHHVETAEALMRDAYREAAAGENVMVVIDSLTRLARVHNAERRSSGRTLSGGMDSRALEIPRRIFGSGRKIEHAGSLTILATILVETGSRMDEVIFEEFKGTGNMEVVLSREIANHRIFPAIDIKKSATRKEELLVGPDELDCMRKIRRALSEMGPVEAAKTLVEQLEKYPTNAELLITLGRKAA